MVKSPGRKAGAFCIGFTAEPAWFWQMPSTSGGVLASVTVLGSL
jgi:hypothetical protein